MKCGEDGSCEDVVVAKNAENILDREENQNHKEKINEIYVTYQQKS